jgi:hypothetical protein
MSLKENEGCTTEELYIDEFIPKMIWENGKEM